jgi:hypothetical protein
MECGVARLSDLVRGDASGPAEAGRSASAKDGDSDATGSETARRWYLTTFRELRRIREDLRDHMNGSLGGCEAQACALVQHLRESDECLRWALQGQTEDYLVDNALRVAVVGVKIGIGLQYAVEELERLALAGLLHDAGMWVLPDALTGKAGSLTTEEQVAVRAHPERGRRILAALGGVYGRLSAIIAQEHERWDGSGYPCRLRGEQIEEQAQVIGLADVFDALVSARPYRKHIAPHQALRELLVHGKQAFSHRVLKALGDQVTLYPVGTAVRLTSGAVGRVVNINPRYPLRPRLELTGDGPAGAGSRAALDLSETPSVHIAEVLSQTGPA